MTKYVSKIYSGGQLAKRNELDDSAVARCVSILLFNQCAWVYGEGAELTEHLADTLRWVLCD